ncbi:MAG: fructosamine kinase family protein [Gemmatimonadota bacterium]
MSPPSHLLPPVAEGIREALVNLGLGAAIEGVTPISGGCINHGARLDTDSGRRFFLKWNADAPLNLFAAEADGLQALSQAAMLRVPTPLARGGGSGTPAWLLLEYIAPGSPAPDFGTALGRGVALLHRAGGEVFAAKLEGGSYGWAHPNWIGSLPQINVPAASWVDFWSRRRIVPQLERSRDSGYFHGDDDRLMDRVVELIPTALADVDTVPPTLLHGDLWSGNVYADTEGKPVVIDPAVYLGHGEVDLAMTELFGGFSDDFYEAYAEVGEITPAYRAYRRDLYQLYYLLVHVNLFGTTYRGQTLAAAGRVVAELGG